MRNFAFYVSMVFTAGMPTYLVLVDRPGSAATIGIIGIFLIFAIRIHDIELFKGLGLEIRLKQAIQDANELSKELKRLAIILSSFNKQLIVSDRFLTSPEFTSELKRKEEMDEALRNLGISENEIRESDRIWNLGICMLFCSKLIQHLDKYYIIHDSKTRVERSHNFANFRTWHYAGWKNIEKYLVDNEMYDDFSKSLVKDLKLFEETGRIVNPERFNDTN